MFKVEHKKKTFDDAATQRDKPKIITFHDETAFGKETYFQRWATMVAMNKNNGKVEIIQGGVKF